MCRAWFLSLVVEQTTLQTFNEPLTSNSLRLPHSITHTLLAILPTTLVVQIEELVGCVCVRLITF